MTNKSELVFAENLQLNFESEESLIWIKYKIIFVERLIQEELHVFWILIKLYSTSASHPEELCFLIKANGLIKSKILADEDISTFVLKNSSDEISKVTFMRNTFGEIYAIKIHGYVTPPT